MDSNDRQAIDGLFSKLDTVERQGGARDGEAEAFIAERVRQQPGAPYFMAQTIVMQEVALENQQREIEALRHQMSSAPQAAAGGGFLSRIFGGNQAPSRPAGYAAPAGAASQYPGSPNPGSPTPASTVVSGPWGGQAGGRSAQAAGYGAQGGMMGGRGGGGGFLAGAAQTAMGVAGGVLLGNALGNMFAGDEPAATETAAAGTDETGVQETAAAEDEGGFFDGGGFDEEI